MKIRDESGKTYTVNLSQYVGKPSLNCSALHERVREFLHEVYPNTQLLEEVYIPGYNIYLDFLLPLYKTVVEADGIQHSQFTPHFHGYHKVAFAHASGRDNKKEEFTRLNNLRLVRLPEGSEPEWMNLIQ